MRNNATKLRSVAASMMGETHTFSVGDLVQWKREELKDRRVPDIDQPAVILELLPEPFKPRINNLNDESSHYTWAQLDIVIGILDDDSEFMHYAADSRRFKPYKG